MIPRILRTAPPPPTPVRNAYSESEMAQPALEQDPDVIWTSYPPQSKYRSHRRVYAQSFPFHGCCGAVQFYMQTTWPVSHLENSLVDLCDAWYKEKSVGLFILTLQQKNSTGVPEFLKKYDWLIKEVWGPIVNVNSKNQLYGFTVNLNEWRERKKSAAKDEKVFK
jgi:hypothetical protein